MTSDNSMTRRQFVAQMAAAVALSAAGPSRQAHAAPPTESLLALTAKHAARALRRGEISAESYARALLNQCRSEEHTSELQSQSNLVCRLLLAHKTILDT